MRHYGKWLHPDLLDIFSQLVKLSCFYIYFRLALQKSLDI